MPDAAGNPLHPDFQRRLDGLKGEFASLDWRVIAAKLPDGLVAVAALLRLSDQDQSDLPFADAFENAEFVFLQSTCPATSLDQVIDGIAAGETTCGGKSVLFRHRVGGGTFPFQPLGAPQFEDFGPRTVSNKLEWRAGLSWYSCVVQEFVGRDWFKQAEPRLRAAGWESLADLVAAKMSGVDCGRDRSAQVQVWAPLNLTLRGKSSGKGLRVSITAGPRIDLNQVKLTALYYQAPLGEYVPDHREPIPHVGTEWRTHDKTRELVREVVAPKKWRTAKLIAAYRQDYTLEERISHQVVSAPTPLISTSAPTSPLPPRTQATWDGIPDGTLAGMTFLSIDFARSRGYAKEHERRAKDSKNAFYRIVETVIPAYGGGFTFTGDEVTAAFHSDDQYDRAVQAGMEILLRFEIETTMLHGEIFRVPLRAAIHCGTATKTTDVGKLDSRELEWAADAQKNGGPAPRLTVSSAVQAKLSPGLRQRFEPRAQHAKTLCSDWDLLSPRSPAKPKTTPRRRKKK